MDFQRTEMEGPRQSEWKLQLVKEKCKVFFSTDKMVLLYFILPCAMVDTNGHVVGRIFRDHCWRL